MSSILERSAPSTSSLPPAKRQKKRSSTLSSSAPPLGKFLASSDKSTRDKAVASLSRFLSAGRLNHLGPLAQAGDDDAQEAAEELPVGDLNWDDEYEVDSRLAPLEMAKLWKGIYYCYWMSDKPLVQQALAQNLADLTLDVRPKSKSRNGRVERFRSALAFLRGFWEAIVREWSTLDHHRLDKFLLLIRRFTHVGFRLLEREQWDARAIEEYNAMLTGPGGPLDVTNDKVPISLAYHLFDIYLDEIERLVTPSEDDADADASATERSLPLLPLLGPMYTTAARAPLQIMFTRLVDNVFTPLLDALLPPKPEPRAKRRRGAAGRAKEPAYPGIRASAVEGAGIEDLSAAAEVAGKKALKRLFEEGGEEETGETQRRRIYNFVTARDVDFEEE